MYSTELHAVPPLGDTQLWKLEHPNKQNKNHSDTQTYKVQYNSSHNPTLQPYKQPVPN